MKRRRGEAAASTKTQSPESVLAGTPDGHDGTAPPILDPPANDAAAPDRPAPIERAPDADTTKSLGGRAHVPAADQSQPASIETLKRAAVRQHTSGCCIGARRWARLAVAECASDRSGITRAAQEKFVEGIGLLAECAAARDDLMQAVNGLQAGGGRSYIGLVRDMAAAAGNPPPPIDRVRQLARGLKQAVHYRRTGGRRRGSGG